MIDGPLWIVGTAMLPVVALAAFAVARGRHLGGQRRARVREAGGSALLSTFIMEFGYWALDGPLRACVRLGITPNQVTFAGLGTVLVGCAALAAGKLGLAGPLILLGSMSDMLDGAVARAQQRGSDAGELVDAVVDRIADVGLYAGLILFYAHRPFMQAVMLWGLAGSLCISYARAKAEALGVDRLPRGLMRRAERTVYLGFAVHLAPLLVPLVEPASDPGTARFDLIWVTVAAIACGCSVGTWRLIDFAADQLRQRDAARSAGHGGGAEPLQVAAATASAKHEPRVSVA